MLLFPVCSKMFLTWISLKLALKLALPELNVLRASLSPFHEEENTSGVQSAWTKSMRHLEEMLCLNILLLLAGRDLFSKMPMISNMLCMQKMYIWMKTRKKVTAISNSQRKASFKNLLLISMGAKFRYLWISKEGIKKSKQRARDVGTGEQDKC